MKFTMLAVDYDRTIATDGRILPAPQEALAELKGAGWLIALVTGREIDDLLTVCQPIDLFDLVVAENGAVLYHPRDSTVSDLAAPPPPGFMSELTRRRIPFSKGRVIVASESIHAAQVESVIALQGLALHTILNKDSAMFLPTGVDKATGLAAGVRTLGVKLSEVVGIGDAENDLVFLRACGFSAAVQNALDAVKEAVDFVIPTPNGEGVAMFIRKTLLRQRTVSPAETVATSALD